MYSLCSLRPKIVFVLAFGFYVCIQMDDDESIHIYETDTSSIVWSHIN
jgi:hypothetical protein